MAGRVSRNIVIDASVARASGGEDAVHRTSKNCRDFLDAVRGICHKLVMSPQISREWNENQSRFASGWRTSMVARRKMTFVGDCTDETLRERIVESENNAENLDEMLNDFHLIEAAIVTDRTVISLDESVKRLFVNVAQAVKELKSVMWVNPDETSKSIIAWLKNGAIAEQKRLIGS